MRWHTTRAVIATITRHFMAFSLPIHTHKSAWFPTRKTRSGKDDMTIKRLINPAVCLFCLPLAKIGLMGTDTAEPVYSRAMGLRTRPQGEPAALSNNVTGSRTLTVR